MPQHEKALIIQGPLENLDDVLHIAKAEAAKIFKTNPEDITVKPYVQPYGHGAYLVVVEADGCRNSSEVVGGRKQQKEK